jgi:hypothetical protein
LVGYRDLKLEGKEFVSSDDHASCFNPVEDVEIVRREWHNLEIVRRQKHSSAIPHDYGPGGPDPDSDSNGDEDEGYHPRPILKKNSRELIRPAIGRSSAGRRPPIRSGSPTFPKAAHFDSNLEHVRHFLQVDRPLAVSIGIDPLEISDIGVELPFNVGGPLIAVDLMSRNG